MDFPFEIEPEKENSLNERNFERLEARSLEKTLYFNKWIGNECEYSGEITIEEGKHLAIWHKLSHKGNGILSREFKDVWGRINLIEIVPKTFVENRLKGL